MGHYFLDLCDLLYILNSVFPRFISGSFCPFSFLFLCKSLLLSLSLSHTRSPLHTHSLSHTDSYTIFFSLSLSVYFCPFLCLYSYLCLSLISLCISLLLLPSHSLLSLCDINTMQNVYNSAN